MTGTSYRSISDVPTRELVGYVWQQAEEAIADVVEDEAEKSATMDVGDYLLALAGILSTYDGGVIPTEAEFIRSWISRNDQDPTPLDSYTLYLMSKTPLSATDEYLQSVPRFLFSIFARDRRTGTTISLFVIDIIREYARRMIAAEDKAGDEKEQLLAKHIQFLNSVATTYGISLDEPATYTELAEPSAKAGDTKAAIAARSAPQGALSTLNGLTGLRSVKDAVKSVVNVGLLSQRRRAFGLPEPDQSLHLVFTGNPGTGKTTVARLLAEIFKDIGLLSRGHLIEVDRSELVAEYVGQTATKTELVIESALGGVLFIDEAYALVANRHQMDYGKEAIDTLLKGMEDHRDDLIVIVAGYPNQMAEFVSSNPGLQSRFTNYIEFNDYVPEELYSIFLDMAQKQTYVLTGGAQDAALNLFNEIYQARGREFANGQSVRNAFELATRRHADRTAPLEAPTRSELVTLVEVDIPTYSEYKETATFTRGHSTRP